MKKFISSMLAICMVLTLFSFTVFAETTSQSADRAIKVYVHTESVAEATDEMYAEELVTVTVKLESDIPLAHAEYALNYNSDYFTLVGKDTTGVIGGFNEATKNVIKHYTWNEEGGYFATGEQLLATYKFQAVAQPTEVSDDFKITDAIATDYDESMEGNRVTADTNEKLVTILLKDYKVDKYIGTIEDGFEKIDETAGEVNEKSFNYDDKTHTFYVVTDPTSTVKYYVNGDEVPAVEIKKEGNHVIRYVVTDQKTGFDAVDKTFTITINKPEYVVEVGKKDYVDGKALVLVYTNTPNVYFSYENLDYEMVDVSKNGYLYDDPNTPVVEDKPYEYTYAYVTAPTANDQFIEYYNNVKWWYEGDKHNGIELKLVPVGDYDADINDDDELTVDDIVVAFGISNGHESYFTTDKYQYKILKLDHNKNKYVLGEDTGYVVDEVKAELGIN